MAFSTKIQLTDNKVFSIDNQPLSLSGDTRIGAASTMQYTTDQSASYIARSVPDAAYVTGRTSTSGVQTVANGLTKLGTNAVLGGSLTGTTTINGAQTLNISTCYINLTGTTGFNLSTGNGIISDTGNKGGLQYAADYSGSIVARSIPDAAYVTGKTNAIYTIGSIGQVIYRDANGLTGCANMIYCDASKSFAFGVGNTAGAAFSSVFGRNNSTVGIESAIFGGVDNSASGTCSVIIGGTGNRICPNAVRSAIIGGLNITLSGATYDDTVGVSCLALMTTPATYLGDILTYDYATKKVSLTTIGSVAGITGVTNGLSLSGPTNQRVGLGGTLTGTTTINGVQALYLGTAASKLATLDLHSVGNTTLGAGALAMSSSGATYTDLTLAAKQGIKYNADYSSTYVDRSLVDKAYVDVFVSGLKPHEAVELATTVADGNIGLSTLLTIDGLSTTTGMRVLVKNQTNRTQNGIYSASTGAWGRTSDYNFTPSGTVDSGDLIPVITGNTQGNTLWVLTTPSPISGGTSNLIYTLFTRVIGINAGAGIATSQSGGNQNICVNLGTGTATGCGLAVDINGLCVNPNIAYSGLSFSAGRLCVNAALGGVASSIPVKLNPGNCIVLNCADLSAAVGAITTANNGLTKSGVNVHLGGALTGTTTVGGTSTFGLNITGLTTFNLGFGAGSAAGIVRDDAGTPRGLQYYGDYYTTFCDNSLITKKYVYSQTSGVTTGYLCCANNGLTKSGQNVHLGGALTGTTTINGAQALHINVTNLNLSGNTAFGLTYGTGTVTHAAGTTGLVYAGSYGATNVARSIPDAAWVTGITSQSIITANNGLNKAGQNVRLGGALTGTTTINGAQILRINVTTLSLSGNTAVNITGTTVNLGGVLTIPKTPVTGTLPTDYLLVWNTIDKCVKIVSGSFVGDKNNVYSAITITTNCTLTCNSPYVIQVSAATPTTIILPTAPLACQVFKIKDVCGNALTNIITVNAGSGRTIDGSQCALINTDYGALELMIGATCKWFTLSFIN